MRAGEFDPINENFGRLGRSRALRAALRAYWGVVLLLLGGRRSTIPDR